MKNHLNIIVVGKVQGVGFRAYAKAEADRLGIVGFVINCEDRSVGIEAEGEQSDLDELLEWCRVGPPGGHVDHVMSVTDELKEYTKFEIRRQAAY